MFDLINKYLTLGNTLLVLIVFLLFIFFNLKNKFRIIIPYLISFIFSIYCYEELILKPDSKIISLGDYASGNYFQKQLPGIGYGPPEKGQYNSLKVNNIDTVYNVNYTINDRIRHTPNSLENSQKQILFFGCSQTFGEGLEDDQTLPYYFGEATSRTFTIKNYGFHGYGPHNIHALIKTLKKDNFNNYETTAVYNLYWYHIGRAINNISGSEPWYEVENDSLVLKGTFFDRDNNKSVLNTNRYIVALNNRLVKRSNIYKKHFNKASSNELKDFSNDDIKRTLFLVKDIADIFKSYDVNFSLVLDEQLHASKQVVNFFKQNNINTFCLECEILDFETNPIYRIPLDGHNSFTLNKLHAKNLKDKLLSLRLIN